MVGDFERPDWIQQMEQVLETVNEGVLIADDCRRLVFVNAGFVRMTGLQPEDLVGKAAQLFYTDEEWAFLEKKIEESIRIGHNRYEFTIPKKDGSRVPVIISSRAHIDSDGRHFGIVTFTAHNLVCGKNKHRLRSHCGDIHWAWIRAI
jgi:PAS domain S-box-containing protein